MEWSPEQIKIFAALGIAPEALPHPLSDAPTPAAPEPMTEKWDLTDAEYCTIQHLMPLEPKQQNALPNRTVLDALLWAQRTGKKLTQLPARYGSAEAVRKRCERWAVGGAWGRLFAALDKIDLRTTLRSDLRNIATTQARRGDRIRDFRAAASP
jgi:transposase